MAGALTLLLSSLVFVPLHGPPRASQAPRVVMTYPAADEPAPEPAPEPAQERRHRRRHRAVLTRTRISNQLARIEQPQLELQQALRSSLYDDASPYLPATGANAGAGEQQLFRHRFLVSSDLCIRLPIEAATLLRAFVVHSHLCGVVHLQLEAFRPHSKVQFCPDAKRMLSLPNAGGSSLMSEALAFEMLARAFGASLEKTELELAYKKGSKMTDFAIQLFGGYPLGVSVTRAYKWRGGREDPSGLDVHEARRLLIKKLRGINASSRNVQNYRWRKQLLFVWAFTHRDALLFERLYEQVPAELRANTVLVIALSAGVNWIR